MRDIRRVNDLLEWQVLEGWELLCASLGRGVPKADFPSGNGTDASMQEVKRMLLETEAMADGTWC